ncbi:MAG: galactokinase [Cyclobacteriaceae bacterium]|jgi:galactokinase
MMNERENLIEKVKVGYKKNFAGEPLLVRAPGRINLIGEHTDYNNGFVLPAAVSHAIYFAIGLSEDSDQCSLISLDFDNRYDFKLSEMKPLEADSWQNYIMGVIAEIEKSGRKTAGFNMVFSGDVPRGSGMSSSAALECGTCFGLNELFHLNIPKVEMVKMSQMAEHNYAGVKCGIMDQFASMMGHQDQALLLDCRSLEYSHFPIVLNDYSLLLCNSNVTHSLASSQYNVRRQQCEEGVTILQKQFPDIESLRDADGMQLSEVKDKMSESVYLRCKYVIEENERVNTFTKVLTENDLVKAGSLLKKAQFAMRYEYEVTCPEIDFMADFANNHKDVLGARMMGGGFGGCTLNLIKKGSEPLFIDELNERYQAEFNKSITPIEVKISDGVSLI